MVDAAIAVAIGAAVTAYMHWVLGPTLASYRGVWQKMGAGFLTIYVLIVLLALGVALGLLVVWSYDRLA